MKRGLIPGRIIAPDGEILVVFPNKAGVWSHTSNTPFAHGHHYTMSQLSDKLSKSGFSIESEERFLYFPPTQSLYTQSFFALFFRVKCDYGKKTDDRYPKSIRITKNSCEKKGVKS